jgi:hypothetical protein
MIILKKSKFYSSIKDESDIVNDFILELIEKMKSKYGASIHYTDTSSSGDLRIEKLINSKSLNAVTIDWQSSLKRFLVRTKLRKGQCQKFSLDLDSSGSMVLKSETFITIDFLRDQKDQALAFIDFAIDKRDFD